MTIDIAVVPVAGLGTRLLPATKSQPKEMLPVGRKPVAQHVVDELAQSGIRRLLFITGKGKHSIENHFDIDGELITYLRETGREGELAELDFERQDLEFFYTRQRRQLGLGHAVLCARPLVGDQPFVVALGDSIIGINAESDIVRRMITTFESSRADVVPEYQKWGLGLVLLNKLLPDALTYGLQEAEFSWVLETNHLSKASLERGGAKLVKSWRMYDGDVA
jgi:UTP--glucose-1-phosphate uridylyltransferase